MTRKRIKVSKRDIVKSKTMDNTLEHVMNDPATQLISYGFASIIKLVVPIIQDIEAEDGFDDLKAKIKHRIRSVLLKR